MFEKVNPEHPDKIADRIAGAVVDLCYTKQENPKVAVEVLIGHGECTIIAETSVTKKEIWPRELISIVRRIAGKDVICHLKWYEQDENLANNKGCGDNGIFKGCPITYEQKYLVALAKDIYNRYKTDGKYIVYDNKTIVCQSNCDDFEKPINDENYYIVNPLGFWTGGINVDSGATNRKLGSDMGDAITGGGLHGKDLSKADVSVNVVCHLLAQEHKHTVEAYCSIGDEEIEFISSKDKIKWPYKLVVNMAKEYIDGLGGFEKLAEWGLIR